MTDLLEQLILTFDNDDASISDSTSSIGGYVGMQSGESCSDSGLVDDVSGDAGQCSVPIGSLPAIRGHDSSNTYSDSALVPREGTRFGEVIKRMHTQLSRSTQRYLSDVFRCKNAGEAEKVSRIIRDDAVRHNNRRFLIIRQHESHVHVIHLCTYSSGHCRCAFIEKAKARANIGKPFAGFRRKYANRIDSSDCCRILLYFLPQQGTKDYHFFIIDGRVERELYRNKVLQEQGHLSNPDWHGEHKMEACLQVDQAELLSVEQIRDATSKTRAGRVPRSLSVGGGRKKDFQKSILLMCEKYCMSPVKSIFNHINWLLDPELQFVREDNKIAQNVIDTYCQLICNWTLSQFFEMYSKSSCNPCFQSLTNHPEDLYYDITESTHILNLLLLYQFNNSEEEVREFLYNLHSVVDRTSVKCNSILVFSPPSGGKNYFFDTILNFCLNKGQMGNPNKHNCFAYQECPGKRIILWNEPNYESSQEEMLKMILGGDNYSVAVKCKQDVAVQRTPVIILTNRYIGLMQSPAFFDRIKQYRWRTAPFLKDYNKKPHPVSIYHLFMQYNIC